MTHAVAFVPEGPLDEIFVAQCLAHCAHRGYEVAGLVRGDWPTVMAMLDAGLASVVVFAREEHIDPAREPRIEVCGETTQALYRHAPGPEPVTNQRRRPHITG